MFGRSWRRLTAGEVAQARPIYLHHLDYARPRIYDGRYLPGQPAGTAMAPNGNVYFPPGLYRPDFSRSLGDMALLIHELGHVWQIRSGVWLKFRRVFLEGGVYDYGRLDAAKPLNRYTVEQQASIIADWYLLRHGAAQSHGSGPIADYQTLVRAAMPEAH